MSITSKPFDTRRTSQAVDETGNPFEELIPPGEMAAAFIRIEIQRRRGTYRGEKGSGEMVWKFNDHMYLCGVLRTVFD